jgi:hypothetical protein
MSDTNRPYYLNITEIRGMPLIVINAYQGIIFILFLVFIRWMVFAIEHVCKRQGTQHADPVATAHAVISPLRRWINSPMSSRRSTQASESFYDDSSVESKEDDTPVGSPTASETRDVESTGTDATLANEGRLSYG